MRGRRRKKACPRPGKCVTLNRNNPSKMTPDPQLSSLLRAWDEAPEVPVGFRREVWARIGNREKMSPLASSIARALSSWILLMGRPRYAAAAAAIVLLIGIFAGSLQARSVGEDLYLRSVDPLSLHVRGK